MSLNRVGRRAIVFTVATSGLLFAHAATAATPPLPLMPGVLTGRVEAYRVKRGETAAGIATRFAVHPVRVYKTSRAALRNGLQYGETIQVDRRRIQPRFYEQVSGVVLNVPEAHVYLVDKGRLVKDYPVGVSRADWKVPIGLTRIVDKTKHPTWHVPKSIQEEMAEAGLKVITKIDPGPRNPLGPRWIGFWGGGYGLHGTNVASSIKRYSSHGCVRFRAADIIDLYDRVRVGMPVRVYYQPVMLAAEGAHVWLSVYPDHYAHGYDFRAAVRGLAKQAGVDGRLNWAAVERAIRDKDGILVDVGPAAGAIKATPVPTPRPRPTLAPATPVPTGTSDPLPLLSPEPMTPAPSPVPEELPRLVVPDELEPLVEPTP